MNKIILFIIGGILGILGHLAIGLFFCPGAGFCAVYVVNFFQLGAIALIVGASIVGIPSVYKASHFAIRSE